MHLILGKYLDLSRQFLFPSFQAFPTSIFPHNFYFHLSRHFLFPSFQAFPMSIFPHNLYFHNLRIPISMFQANSYFHLLRQFLLPSFQTIPYFHLSRHFLPVFSPFTYAILVMSPCLFHHTWQILNLPGLAKTIGEELSFLLVIIEIIEIYATCCSNFLLL